MLVHRRYIRRSILFKRSSKIELHSFIMIALREEIKKTGWKNILAVLILGLIIYFGVENHPRPLVVRTSTVATVVTTQFCIENQLFGTGTFGTRLIFRFCADRNLDYTKFGIFSAKDNQCLLLLNTGMEIALTNRNLLSCFYQTEDGSCCEVLRREELFFCKENGRMVRSYIEKVFNFTQEESELLDAILIAM